MLELRCGYFSGETDLGEQRIQTVNLLSLLDVRVILGNTSKRQLLHQVNFIRVFHVLLLKRDMSECPTSVRDKQKRTLKSLTMMGKVALNNMT